MRSGDRRDHPVGDRRRPPGAAPLARQRPSVSAAASMKPGLQNGVRRGVRYDILPPTSTPKETSSPPPKKGRSAFPPNKPPLSTRRFLPAHLRPRAKSSAQAFAPCRSATRPWSAGCAKVAPTYDRWKADPTGDVSPEDMAERMRKRHEARVKGAREAASFRLQRRRWQRPRLDL